LAVIVVPSSRLAPFRAFQVPPVSVPPEIWPKEAGSRSRVPESASMVPVLSISPSISSVEMPVPLVLRITPAFTRAVVPPGRRLSGAASDGRAGMTDNDCDELC
jgi:hypothetical protein